MKEETTSEPKTAYDLEDRMLDYGARIVRLCRSVEPDLAGKHIAAQLLRSGTAPLAHHGEAQGAESPADFIHKLRLALKELRESERWLKLIVRAEILPESKTTAILGETDQLIRIFVSSISTAMRKNSR